MLWNTEYQAFIPENNTGYERIFDVCVATRITREPYYFVFAIDWEHTYIESGKDVRAVRHQYFKRARGRAERETKIRRSKTVFINNQRFIFKQTEWKKSEQPKSRIEFWIGIQELYRLDRQEAKKKSPKLMKMTERHLLMKLQGRQSIFVNNMLVEAE